jgi:hypothetical protein
MLMDEIREKINLIKKDKKDTSQLRLACQTWDPDQLFPDHETGISPYKVNKKNYKA